MMAALKELKDLSKTVGTSVEDAIEKFSGVQKEWDGCMKSYNKSLDVYEETVRERWRGQEARERRACEIERMYSYV